MRRRDFMAAPRALGRKVPPAPFDRYEVIE